MWMGYSKANIFVYGANNACRNYFKIELVNREKQE